jgi:hypothetical protein
MTERLAKLADLKTWLSVTTDASDGLLGRLLDAASQFVLSYINRPTFALTLYTQNFRGNGKEVVLLRSWPVIEVISVGLSNLPVPQAVFNNTGFPTTSGYSLSDFRDAPQSVELYGYCFYFKQPCRIVYTAGYQGTDSLVIPASPFKLSPNDPGCWIADGGVQKAGVDMVKVTGTPTTGQYAVDAIGEYLFAAADVGQPVNITFSYAPLDISQAVIELAGEWLKRKDRIGIVSKGLAGGISENISFSRKDMNETVNTILQLYCSVVPV